jgi:hypothetical protein
MAANSSCPAGSSIHAALFALLIACAALFFGSAEAGAAHRVIDPEWHPATATWYGSDGKTFKSISHVRSFSVYAIDGRFHKCTTLLAKCIAPLICCIYIKIQVQSLVQN